MNLLPMKFGTFLTTAHRNEFCLHFDEYLIDLNIKATLLTTTVGFQFLAQGAPLDEEDPEQIKPCLIYCELLPVADSALNIVRFRCASGNRMAFV